MESPQNQCGAPWSSTIMVIKNALQRVGKVGALVADLFIYTKQNPKIEEVRK